MRRKFGGIIPVYQGIGRKTMLSSSIFRHISPRAFTLLELLTVVAIISALVALSATALSGARKSVRSSVCLSNLRQLGASCSAYATSDEKSLILPAHPISDVDELHHDGRFDWGGASGKSAGWGGTYGPTGPRAAPTRPLNSQLYGSNVAGGDFRVFQCPDDVGSPDRSAEESWWWTPDFRDTPYFVSVGNSYQGNALRHHEWQGRWATPPFQIVGVFLRPVARIPSTSETVLLIDGGGFIWRSGQWPENYRYGIRRAGWHGSDLKYNVAYADGHAEQIVFLEDFEQGDWRTDNDGYGYWVRFGRTRWDCRPQPLLADEPNAQTQTR